VSERTNGRSLAQSAGPSVHRLHSCAGGRAGCLNRLESVPEALRAALNAVATVAPEWLRALAPAAWDADYLWHGNVARAR
jgi:hypothetical protein